MPPVIPRRIANAFGAIRGLYEFFLESDFAQRGHLPGANLLVVGDPQEMALPGFVAALRGQLEPQNPQWYAYKLDERPAQEAAAAGLRQRTGIGFLPEDVHLTNGAFAALTVAIKLMGDPGDELIFLSPPWFFYEAIILAEGLTPVRVKVNPATFDPDLDAIAAAITPRTRAVLINSPNNPTGRIYSPEVLQGLAETLTALSRRYGRDITLISDESYSRILFDGNRHHSPAAYYPHTFVIYTYGKTLLTPGQRMGYIALPPNMPDREAWRPVLIAGRHLTGYAYPNALMQYALPELEMLSIDLEALRARRDRLVPALRGMGYELHVPQGTFYLLPRSPMADDVAFVKRLAAGNVFVLPGAAVEMPGYFRISLTASDDMVERALPVFAEATRTA